MDYGKLMLESEMKIRKGVCVAVWDAEKGVAKVTVTKGKLWCSMGVIKNSKLFFNVEEIVYLVEIGDLVLLHNDAVMSTDEVYCLLLTPANGCSWSAYQIFAHLKRLGYIVGRHGVPWTTSRKREILIPVKTTVDGDQPVSVEEQINPLQGVLEPRPGEVSTPSQDLDDADCDSNSTTTGTEGSIMSDREEKYLNEAAVPNWDTGRPEMHRMSTESNIDVLQNMSHLTLNKDEDTSVSQPMYDVYLPNGRFRKSSPGLPDFRLCVGSCQPPKHNEIRALELKSGGVPLKFAVIESGHVFVVSFDRVSVPALP